MTFKVKDGISVAGSTFVDGSRNTTTNNLTVGGNLTVSGTTTTINTATLEVADLNITVAKNAATAAAANGAGLTVAGAAATILYTSATDTWNFNKNIVATLTGNASGLSDTGNYMYSRGTIADASIDTAIANGFYLRSYTGASASTLTWNAGGSTGPVQFDVSYGNTGTIRLRNKTDSTTWSAWRIFLTDQNIASYAVSSISATTPILTSASTGAVTLSHATSGVTAGTYNNVTVNTFGHVTAGSNIAYLTALSDTLQTVTTRGNTTTTSVSIGSSTAPDFRLVVTGDTNTRLRVDGSTSSGVYFTQSGANAGTISATTADGFKFYTATAGLAAHLTTDGNFGVGISPPAYKLHVAGSFAATTKSFVIDHPTKPGMKLRYGSLEGPENGVYIRGRLKGNKIELPEYWTKLVDADSITVNLTAIGKSQDIYVEDIMDNVVYVASDDPLSSGIDCFYTVFAERIDVNKLEVEIE